MEILPEEFSSEGIIKKFAKEEIANRNIEILRSSQGSKVLFNGFYFYTNSFELIIKILNDKITVCIGTQTKKILEENGIKVKVMPKINRYLNQASLSVSY